MIGYSKPPQAMIYVSVTASPPNICLRLISIVPIMPSPPLRYSVLPLGKDLDLRQHICWETGSSSPFHRKLAVSAVTARTPAAIYSATPLASTSSRRATSASRACIRGNLASLGEIPLAGCRVDHCSRGSERKQGKDSDEAHFE